MIEFRSDFMVISKTADKFFEMTILHLRLIQGTQCDSLNEKFFIEDVVLIFFDIDVTTCRHVG